MFESNKMIGPILQTITLLVHNDFKNGCQYQTIYADNKHVIVHNK